MNWPDVRPVLLMAVRAQERETWTHYLWRGGVVQKGVCWGRESGPELFIPRRFDPPSHDGTDPWKWQGSKE